VGEAPMPAFEPAPVATGELPHSGPVKPFRTVPGL
jgi:hypothetical protein